MGLFDQVLGAFGGNAQGGGLSDLIKAASANPELLNAVTGLLGNNGTSGGLQGLLQQATQAGLGDIVASWIGKGDNLPIAPDQVGSLLGGDTLKNLATQLGVAPSDAAQTLATVLPAAVDQLTPDGSVPVAGLGNGSDLMSALGALLKA